MSEHPIISHSSDPEFLPINFLDDEGNRKGIAADYIHLLEQKIKVKFKVLALKDWDEVLEKTKKKENDTWSTTTPTPERREYMLFTKPFLFIQSKRGSQDYLINLVKCQESLCLRRHFKHFQPNNLLCKVFLSNSDVY